MKKLFAVLCLSVLFAMPAAAQAPSSNQISSPTATVPDAMTTPSRTTEFEALQAKADKGDPDAEYQMGLHFDDRVGITGQYDVAAGWYEKAADQGNVDAQFKLGELYKLALGVSQNFLESYYLFSLAASGGNKEYAAARDDAATHLNPDQIAAIDEHVKAWKPTHPAPAAPAPAATPVPAKPQSPQVPAMP